MCVFDVAFAPTHNRTYEDLAPCLVEESDNTFVDADWSVLDKVKTVESKEEFPKGWRSATMYQLRVNPKRVCLYFGGEEYEGIVMLRIRTDQKQVYFLFSNGYNCLCLRFKQRFTVQLCERCPS